MMDFPYRTEVEPKEDNRFRWALEQGFDESCGFAAVASAMGLYWGDEAREGELVDALFRDRSELRSISLADMKRIAEERGFSVLGLRAGWDELAGILVSWAPVIVHYDKPTGHFSLLLSARDGMAVTADPVRGLEILDRGRFEGRWSGALLVVASKERHRRVDFVLEAVRTAEGRSSLQERLAREKAR
jgi:predicted double-glycine peptidase